MYSPIGCSVRIDDSEQEIRGTIPDGSTFYLAPNQFRVSIASGAAIDAGLTSVDVTKVGVAENVALYAALQAYENAMQNYINAIQAAITPLLAVIEPPPLFGPLTLTLNATFAALGIAQTNAVNPLLASSSVLRASPT